MVTGSFTVDGAVVEVMGAELLHPPRADARKREDSSAAASWLPADEHRGVQVLGWIRTYRGRGGDAGGGGEAERVGGGGESRTADELADESPAEAVPPSTFSG